MLTSLDDGLWVADSPQRFYGLEIGSRMTVVRLPGPRLWVHSPVAPSPELRAQVDALGPVTHLVAPNRFHHLSIDAWHHAYPDAQVHAAPTLCEKRPALASAAVLADTPDAAWADALEQCCVAGYPLASEVVFFHRPTQTLIVTDLAFNLGPDSPRMTRVAFRLCRAYGRLSSTPLERLFVKDRPAFRASLERILAWPFERVIVSHGQVLEHGARAAFERSYQWVLKTGR